MEVPLRDRDAVVLLSGGFDSTVLTWWALSQYNHVRCIGLDFGQDHRRELARARIIAARGGVPFDRVQVRGLRAAPRDHRQVLFVRGRNSTALGLAALSVGWGAADILFGSLVTDVYADAGAGFMSDMTRAFAGPGSTGAVEVQAPLLALAGKSDVAQLGYQLGAPLHLTWSCMTPKRRRPCGTCPPCQAREEAIASLDGITAPELGPPGAWLTRNGSPFDPVPHRPNHAYRGLVEELLAWPGTVPWRRGWRYRGPDGTVRFSTTSRPTWLTRRRYSAPGEVRYLRVVESADITTQPSWEFVVLADGSVGRASGDTELIAAAVAHRLLQ